jgi:transposase
VGFGEDRCRCTPGRSTEYPGRQSARVARTAFPKGSLATRIRDELGEPFSDADFAGLCPNRGKPAWSPGRPALVSVMQFAEGLSDRQAADAVRGRLDWKYLLGLELGDPGFDHSVLTEFRDRLIAGDAGVQLLDWVLEAAGEHGLLTSGGRAITDSTIVLSAGRRITLRPQAGYEAIQQARAQEDTQEWQEQYAHRAGVEGSISQGARAFGLRPAPMPVSRPGQGPAAASTCRHRRELPTPQRLVDRDPTSPHTHITPGSPPARRARS